MNEINLIKSEPEDLEQSKTHYFQVDALKALMIFLVIFDHTIPWTIKGDMGVALWERISIPVFLVIMGFNMGNSFKQKGDVPLRELYSKSYFKNKILRYIVPFLILYIISTVVGLILYSFDFNAMIETQLLPHFGVVNLIMGILPFWGPGNWFIPIIFQSILIMPLLYKGFSSKPIWSVLTLISCFVIEIAAQLFIFFCFGPPPFPSWEIYYSFLFIICSVFIYLSAIGLGLWFSMGYGITEKRNLFMWILFPLSVIYLIIYMFFDFRFDFIRGDYNLFIFPYSAFLFLIGMKLLPERAEGKFAKGIAVIGKATYHILLTQILYFGIVVAIWGDHYCASIIGINPFNYIVCFTYLPINWVICIPLGVLWYLIETKIRKRRISIKIN